MTLCECGCGKEVKQGNQFIKGHNNRGIHFSEEHCKKISQSEMGKVVLEKSKMYGNKNPTKRLYIREKISNALKGQFSGENHPMYGKHHSEESKQKNRESHLGKNPWNLGLKASEKAIKNQSKAQKGNKSHRYGKPPSEKSCCGKGKYYDSPLQGKIWLRSSYELAYAKYLDENKILWMYEMETFDLGDTSYTPDFFLPKTEQFIEIKGWMRPEAQLKINKFLEQYSWDLEILYKEDLIKLGCEL